MSTQKIDSPENVEQNPGFIRDYSFDDVGFQHPWNMGGSVSVQPTNTIMGGSVSVQPTNTIMGGSVSVQPTNTIMGGSVSVQPTNTIMGGFQTPGAAFYATERCMGFPSSQFPSFHAIQIQSVAPDQPNYESTNTLQSISKSHISCHQCTNTQSNLLGNNAATIVNDRFSVPFRGNQDQRAQGSSPATLSFFQQEKQSSNYSSGNTASTLASKTRIRWTQDLHDKFVECVKRLGGAEKATPKAILKLMDTQGLTIFHVKSHLQKYRIAKYMPDSAQGKSQKPTTTSDVTQIDVKTGLHLTETLQLQLDVQRRLHEQLEIQRNLQLRIEEQGRQLKMMIDQQQKTRESLLKKQDHDPSFSFEDVEASIAESSGTAYIPSNIS